jgi:hypothetical protein
VTVSSNIDLNSQLEAIAALVVVGIDRLAELDFQPDLVAFPADREVIVEFGEELSDAIESIRGASDEALFDVVNEALLRPRINCLAAAWPSLERVWAVVADPCPEVYPAWGSYLVTSPPTDREVLLTRLELAFSKFEASMARLAE